MIQEVFLYYEKRECKLQSKWGLPVSCRTRAQYGVVGTGAHWRKYTLRGQLLGSYNRLFLDPSIF